MEGRMKTLRKAVVTSALVVLGGLSLGGCATTGYVDEKIAAVNARIDGLEARVQQNADAVAAANSATQANSQRIDQLTGRVDALEQRMAAKAPRN
jgi:outer membrane murein-binding lipoprotein Lpp